MAALTKRQPRVAGSVSGNQPQVRVYEVATGITVRTGNVCIEAAGKVDNAVAAFTADTILGVSLHAAKEGTAWYLGSTNQEDSGGTFGGDFMGASDLLGSVEGIGVHLAVANDDSMFEFGLDEALALADLGALVELALASGLYSVIKTLGANADFATIVAIPNYPDQAIGDTNARVLVQVLASASALY